METVSEIKWEWDDLLEMINQTENEFNNLDILSDEAIINDDFMNCKVGYKRNFNDLLSETKTITKISESQENLICGSFLSRQAKKFKYS
jgi:hypothetical protein